MKTLTEQLLEASQGVLNLQPEVSDSTGKYHMFDDGGVESEVGEFLYGIVKVLKPEKILETGTYSGISSMYMAQGLKDNGFGHLTTVEYEITHKNRAEKLWGNCGLSEFVTCKLQSSLDFNPDNYELIFLDTEPNLRFKELVKFFPNLKDGGYFISTIYIVTCLKKNTLTKMVNMTLVGRLEYYQIKWLNGLELVSYEYFPSLPLEESVVFINQERMISVEDSC